MRKEGIKNRSLQENEGKEGAREGGVIQDERDRVLQTSPLYNAPQYSTAQHSTA